MRTFRYDAEGQWFRGNTHIHSTISDGGKTPAELAHLYGEAGYDFICHTDHWVASDVANDGVTADILRLDGVELDGRDDDGHYYHVVCLGRFEGLRGWQEMSLSAAMECCREQEGILILAHPHWSRNTLEDARRHRFHSVEVYNHVCHWLNGRSYGAVHWDAMLEHFPNTCAVAADDAHIKAGHPGWNGGWIMVKAPACSQKAIMQSIRNGCYYSSCGPEIFDIVYDNGTVHLTTSPARFIRVAAPERQGRQAGSFDHGLITEATFDLPEAWTQVRLEVEDAHGRCAWTNPIFVLP